MALFDFHEEDDDEDLMKVIPMTSFVILRFEIKSKISICIESSCFSTLSNSAFTCNCNLTVFPKINYIIRP